MSHRFCFKFARVLYVGVILLIIATIFLPVLTSAQAYSNTQAPIPVKIMAETIQYRLGDSPVASDGIPLWTYGGYDSLEWVTLTSHEPPPVKDGETVIWLRIKLPQLNFDEPGIFLISRHQAFEAYFNNELIYKFGQIDTKGTLETPNLGWNVIPLTSSYQGKFLYLRIYTAFNKYLGILDDLQIGNRENFILNIFRDNVDQLILSFFFICVAAIMYSFYILRGRNDKSFAALSFFSACIGIFTISASNISQLLINKPFFWFYVFVISLYLSPIGICILLDQILSAKKNSLCKRLWQLHIFYAALTLILDLTNVFPIVYTLDIFSVLLIILIVILLGASISSSIKGNKNAKILTFGITFLCLTSIFDLLFSFYELLPLKHRIFPWGMFVFIITLVFILGRRLAEIYDKLKLYSQEIEIKNTTLNTMWEEIKISKDKITDRNNALEERTSELETANLDLKTLLETLRLAQKQLVQSERMAAIGSLVAGVSHEINTPLGISITATSYLEQKLKSFVDLFQSNSMKKSDLESYLSISTDTVLMIMSNLRKASELVKSFKQVAVDQSTEQKRSFNVKSYINEILLSLSPKLKKTKHSIVVKCEDTIEIYSFPGALYQVITNLIMNSVIHAYDDGEGGNILIDVSIQNDNLILKYSDDGKGIDSKIIDKIFNPFFTTKRNKGGTGLGLHISYNIVKQTLGGNIECSSKPGNGTTFIINIPLLKY